AEEIELHQPGGFDIFHVELGDRHVGARVAVERDQLIEGAIAGLGLFATGIPNAAFWTFVMIVLALLPLIGAFMVWAPAAGYLFVIGEAGSATLLFAYGIVVVSMIDNYARPILIDREAQLNPGVILVGVFGGVYALGFVGLFVGPIALGVLAAALVTFAEEYDRL
ncbi:MAG: AI-2E family transporter, partial [Halalkalicoccus sp.]